MCKLKKLLISGLLAFSLVGCSSKEEEFFNQGNVGAFVCGLFDNVELTDEDKDMIRNKMNEWD